MSVQKYCMMVLRVMCIIGFFSMGMNLFMDTDNRLQEVLAGILCIGVGMEYGLNLVCGKEEWR